MSSRNNQDIVRHLRDYSNLELSSDKNKDDITLFVGAKTYDLIKRGKLLRLSTNKEELRDDIIDQVTRGANSISVISSIISHNYVLLI